MARPPKPEVTVRKKSKLASFGRVVLLATTVAAIAQELQQPADKRTWHGTVGGFVPYDFRPPTLERMQRSWWNPGDERVLTPQVFGVGWTLNFGRLMHLWRASRTP
jgi:hypothetical protein